MAQTITLPVTFEESIDYELRDFEPGGVDGPTSTIVADPTDPSNMVVQTVRPSTAVCYAGTTVAENSGFASPIPFAEGATTMNMRVWSPEAGIRVRIKVEKVGDPTVSVETDAFTTTPSAWETLVFDFANQATGTAALNFASEYTKASVFFDIQCADAGATPMTRTYYWDDLAFGSGGGMGGAGVVINEVLYDPAADDAGTTDVVEGDANGDGTRDGSEDEFVEIVNLGDTAVDLSGYVIEDAASFGSDDDAFVRHTFSAGTMLGAGAAIVVFGGGSPTGDFGGATVVTASNTGGIGLNNGGDTVYLLDAAGTTVAEYTYDGTVQDEAVARNPDGTGDFGAHSAITTNAVAFSPGLKNADGTAFATDGGGDGPMARLQIIHNSPDPAAATVDVYVNDARLLDDLDFREATPFIDVAAGVTLSVDIVAGDAADNSSPVFEMDYVLLEDNVYQLIANGVVGTGFAANPDNVSTAFSLLVGADAQEEAVDGSKVEVRVVHGSPDAPTVDIRAGETVLVDDATFGDVTGYINLDPAAYTLDITTADGSATAASFTADLSGFAGEAATVLASGFLTPADDNDGPSFGLLVVLPDGASQLFPIVVSLAEARALGAGAAVTVSGTVTRTAGAFTYVQSGDTGLTIRQTGGPFADAVAAGTIAPGTELTLSGTLSEFRQLLQINGADLTGFEITGTGDVPEPQLVTLSELATNGEAYEGELVTVRALAIDADGDATFQAGTNYAVTDDSDATNAVTLRIPNANDTSADGTAIPAQANVTAIVGQFDNDDPAVGYQLLVVDAADVANSVSTEGGAAAELSLTVANPIRLGADVRFTLDAPGEATVALYDALGRRVATLVAGDVGPGEQTARLDATALASGVYVLRLEAESGVVTRAITVVR